MKITRLLCVWTTALAMGAATMGCCGEDTDGGGGGGDEREGGGEAVVLDGPLDADLGFKPERDGFGFENYGNDDVKNLTAAEVEYLFGPEVCAGHSEDKCLLTPSGRQWLEQTNQAMDGGHCEGMAVLSLLLYSGEVPLEEFGDASSTAALPLKGNPKLQRELALWFATQATTPTVDKELSALSPKAAVAKLRASFEAGKEGALYSLGIYKEDMSGGHAVTPYALRDKGEGKVDVLLYDNNHPKRARVMSIDLEANTWSYSASTNPDEAEDVYRGDATTGNLSLTPMGPRLQKQACPFCGESADGYEERGGVALKGNKVDYAEIWLDGPADLLLTDDKGRRMGLVDGKRVNEIPGAKAVVYRSDKWRDDQEPVYRVPLGTPLTITLDGSRLKAPADSEVTLIAPAYTLEVDDVVLEPGQQDTIEVEGDLRGITYITEGMETPEILLGVTRPGADYEFIVSAGGDDDGHAISLALDLKNSSLAIGIKGRSGDTDFDIEMARIDEDGEDVFVHEDQAWAEDEAAVMYIDFGDWKGDGAPLTIRVDEDGDGETDKNEEMEDR